MLMQPASKPRIVTKTTERRTVSSQTRAGSIIAAAALNVQMRETARVAPLTVNL